MRYAPSLPLVLVCGAVLLGPAGCGTEDPAPEPVAEVALDLEVLAYTGKDGLDRFYFRATARNVGGVGTFSREPCGEVVVRATYADGSTIPWSNPCGPEPAVRPCPLLEVGLEPGQAKGWDRYMPGSIWINCDEYIPNPPGMYTATWTMRFYEEGDMEEREPRVATASLTFAWPLD